MTLFVIFIVILDKNQVQETGKTKDVMNIDPAPDKWKSFGFEVFDIDGHNMEEIVKTLDKAEKIIGKPVMIVANTIKGKGVSFLEDQEGWHGKALDKEAKDLRAQVSSANSQIQAQDKQINELKSDLDILVFIYFY